MPNRRFPSAACAAALLLALPLGACAAQVSEQQLIRPVPGGTLNQAAVAEAAPGYSVERRDFAATDGARLHAVHLRQPGARATLLYFGGNGYTIERFGPHVAAFFHGLGVDLMIVDHRGYGLSEGRPTLAALEADGLAAFDFLAGLPGVDQERIFVHGHSLGSFIAGHVAANRDSAGVALESSVTTTEDWVAAQTRGAAGAVVRVRIDEGLRGKGNMRNLANIAEPLLLLVGANDRTTPPRLSEALFQASPLPATRKFLAVIAGAGHGDVLVQRDAATAYRAFIEAALAPR